MNYLFVTIFIVSTYLVQQHECTVKITGYQYGYLNPRYVSRKTLQLDIEPSDNFHNNLRLRWNLKTNLPDDLQLSSRVYVTDRYGNRPGLLLNVSIPICEETDKRVFLPNFLKVDSCKLGERCFKKGYYDIEDAGQLDFERLVYNLANEGSFYKAIYTLRSRYEDIFELGITSMWASL